MEHFPSTFCGVCSYPLKQNLHRVPLDGMPYEQRKPAPGAPNWHATLVDFYISVRRGCEVCIALKNLITELNGCDEASLKGAKCFKLEWRLWTDGSLACFFELDRRLVHHEFEVFLPSLCQQTGRHSTIIHAQLLADGLM
jgi:hypothetical protein